LKTYLFLLLLINLNFISLALASSSSPTNLLFCYEDKSLPPYFLGQGSVVPTQNPGETIELIQYIDDRFSNLKVNYIRKPWKRCLDDLSKSKVDAVIGSYHVDREKIGVYPKVRGVVDPSKAISKHAVCFIKHKNSSFSWDGVKINSTNKMVVGVTAGYMIIKVLEQLPVIIHETLSADQALILLEKKRVDAAVSLCQINKYAGQTNPELKSQFSLVYPPLHVKSGYLIFSHGYYHKNSKLVERIWKYLINLNTEHMYNRYKH